MVPNEVKTFPEFWPRGKELVGKGHHLACLEARYGRLVYFSGDAVVGRSLQEYGEWAQKELEFIDSFDVSNANVVDVGAYIGTHTLAFSRFVSERGTIYSIEPHPKYFDVLKENISINKIGNVVPINCALSDQPGVAYMDDLCFSPSQNLGGARISVGDTTGNRIQVEVRTLDSLSLDSCGLIKIDVEGMEANVLAGGRATIERCKPVVVAECNSADAAWSVVETVRTCNYCVFLYSETAFNSANYFENANNIFSNARELAIVCVPVERRNIFQKSIFARFEITPIDKLDDLVLSLIKKPQYKFEVLGATSGAALWGNSFWLNESEMEELNGLTAKLYEAVAERDAQIAGLNEAVAERDGRIAESNPAFEHCDRRIARLIRVAESRAARLATLVEAQDLLRSEVAAMSRVLHERKDVLGQRNQLLHALNRIQTSATWQLSRILRSLEYRWPGAVRGLAALPKLAWWTLSFRLPSRLRIRRQAAQISASGLFDLSWFIEHNPDVVLGGLSPVYHWLLDGWKQSRNPGPGFDTDRYLHDHPEILSADINPLVHYETVGRAAGFAIYPVAEPDSADQVFREAGGSRPNLPEDEGTEGGPTYDWARYLFENPDIQTSGMEPADHYSLFGRFEGRVIHLIGDDKRVGKAWADMLPSSAPALPVPAGIADGLAVVIPVYLGFEETRRCLHSALVGRGVLDYRIIVVNDCSPDPGIVELLSGLNGQEGLIVLNNADNAGFVRSVNRGLEAAGRADIILLNSDTEVAPSWADRLAAQAYAADDVGTVTPFSNNATICSYPDMRGRSDLPGGECTADLDLAFAEANRGRSLDIPTAVGFCMYIKRDCLDEVGFFDIEAFGKGYGEENDFCMRAHAWGWRNILAADVFVYHSGEVSFGAGAAAKKEAALAVLSARYPEYPGLVNEFVSSDSPSALRVAATAARYRLSGLPAILLVTHSLGGGTEKHVQELVRSGAGQAMFLILRPTVADRLGNDLVLESGSEPDVLQLPLRSQAVQFIAALLASFGVTRAHVHHLYGYSDTLQRVLYRLDVPFDFTVHDYYALCPRINLMTHGSVYCGELGEAQCLKCLKTDAPSIGVVPEILSWRLARAWVFHGAERVICPSHDVARRIARYYPAASCIVVPHECKPGGSTGIAVPLLASEERCRVAVLGALARHKGLEIIDGVARLIAANALPLELTAIGCRESAEPLNPALRETGPYRDEDLQQLIREADPHLILFPARWPETYSYTLSAALEARRPVAVADIGAFTERISGRPWSWTIEVDVDAHALTERLLAIADDLRSGRAPKEVGKSDCGVAPQLSAAEFYPELYLSGAAAVPLNHFDESASDPVLVLPEGGEIPSPCSYIRLLIPFAEETTAKALRFQSVSLATLLEMRPQVVVTNRIALTDAKQIDLFLTHCRNCGTRIIYDIDDDLLDLPEDHAEADAYRLHKANVSRLVREADTVWASTPALAERLTNLNGNVLVMPNGIRQDWCGVGAGRGQEQADGLRVLYMGTPTHGADFGIAREALAKLAQTYVGRVSVTLIGVIADQVTEPWLTQKVPPSWARSYPYFMTWLSMQGPFDLGIAPLVSSAFNECKSPIKALDYACLGLPTLASDCTAYRAVIHPGENGLLAEGTVESWYRLLEECLLNPHETARLGERAAETLRRGYDVRRFAGLRKDSLRAMLDPPRLDPRASTGVS